MDAAAHPSAHQTVNVSGSNNTVIVAGRDVHNHHPPPRGTPATDPATDPQPRPGPYPGRRSLRAYTGGTLTLVVAAFLRVFILGSPLLPPSEWPEGKTAQCNDRWFSTSQGSGTCSSHGGVAFWREKEPEPSRSQPSVTGPTGALFASSE